MKTFLQRFGELVLGVLHGFDRMRLRGSKRQLCYPVGAASYLGHIGVRLTAYTPSSTAALQTRCHFMTRPGKPWGLR